MDCRKEKYAAVAREGVLESGGEVRRQAVGIECP